MAHSHRRIYWVTPTSIMIALLTGIALALGHHLFYARLSGQVAPSGDYHVWGSTLAKQQLNIAIGTPFAFMVNSSLAIAVTSSYTQLFWHILRTSTKPTMLKDVDTAFSLLQDLTMLFSASTWRKQYNMLAPIALIFWYVGMLTLTQVCYQDTDAAAPRLLPLASIPTPATLSVCSAPTRPSPLHTTAVPKLDLLNQHFSNWNSYGGYLQNNGPSTLFRRVAFATAAQGGVLPITPVSLNASWTTQFRGPAIHCNNVSDETRIAILEDYGANEMNHALQTFGKRNIPLNTYEQHLVFRFRYISWVPTTPNDFRPFHRPQGPQETISYDFPPTIYVVIDGLNDQTPTWNSSQAPRPDNQTVESLGAYVSMLRNFTTLSCVLYNSSYSVDFRYTNGSQDVGISRQDLSTDVRIKASTPLLSLGNTLECAGIPCAQRMAYTSINNAFNSLLVGTLSYLGYALEETGTFDVVKTFNEWHNIYICDASTLWASYGAAIFSTTLSVLVGFFAMRSNGTAYDVIFSTVLRASRFRTSSVDNHHAQSGDGIDDGSKPLPASFAKAVVVVNKGRRRSRIGTRIPGSGGVQMGMLQHSQKRRS